MLQTWIDNSWKTYRLRKEAVRGEHCAKHQYLGRVSDDARKERTDLGLRLPGLRDLDRIALDPTFHTPESCNDFDQGLTLFCCIWHLASSALKWPPWSIGVLRLGKYSLQFPALDQKANENTNFPENLGKERRQGLEICMVVDISVLL